jgi:hypothetical protein
MMMVMISVMMIHKNEVNEHSLEDSVQLRQTDVDAATVTPIITKSPSKNHSHVINDHRQHPEPISKSSCKRQRDSQTLSHRQQEQRSSRTINHIKDVNEMP